MNVKKTLNQLILHYTKRYDPYTDYEHNIGKSREFDSTSVGNILIRIIGGAYGHLFED